MDGKTSRGKVIMNKEQLLLFMENRRKQYEDHRLAVKNATTISGMVDRKASGKIIMNKDQQPMFSEEYILRIKNIISEIAAEMKRMKVSKDGATKKFVEQDSAAGDGTNPSI